MGNTAVKLQDKPLNTIMQHPRFANARLTLDKKVVLEYKYTQKFNQMAQGIYSLNPQNKKLPLLLPKIEMMHRQNFCGVDSTVNLIFNYYPFTLYEEIIKRKAMKFRFEQTELWFLLYHLTNASTIFQKKQQKSGDIRPKNIFIDVKGDIVVINSLSFPDEVPNYYKSLYNKEKTYLAPQELTELQRQAKYCKVDQVLAQTFSIGLTMLDACLLTNSEQLYDCQQLTFKSYHFQQDLATLKDMNFSPFFIKTVLNLLQVQCFNRPTPGQVLALILPYEKEILDLTEFIPDRIRSQQSLQAFQSRKY